MSEAEREQLMRLVTQARDNLSPSGS
jgi:hypothetical protein